MIEPEPIGVPLSVSRVKIADTCTLKYRYRYLDELKEPEEAAAKVFGTVVHVGVEQWYGERGSENHRNTNLRDYVHKLWFEHLPQDIGIALRHCVDAERDQAELEQLIRISRPTIKSPRTTKDFLTSEQYKRFEDTRDELLAAASKCEDMRWAKDENAFQAWHKSMGISNQLQALWQDKPRPLAIEQEFTYIFAGVEVRGRIDQIRADPDPLGQALIRGVDLKTGRQLMSQMEGFLQMFLYHMACLDNPALPVPDYWTFWMARHNKPQNGRIDPERHGKLAERILKRVARQIAAADYAPHYGSWCSWCDYRAVCAEEISIWPPGEDSLVLEMPQVQAAA